MATLQEILTEQVKLIAEASKTLEAAQKKPPAIIAPTAAKEATVAELKSRIANLAKAKAEAVRQFDDQMAAYQSEITALDKQIEEDKKRFGEQPPHVAIDRRPRRKK
jgi:phage I-like protein